MFLIKSCTVELSTLYTVCVIGECKFVSLAPSINPFTSVGKTTFLVKQ